MQFAMPMKWRDAKMLQPAITTLKRLMSPTASMPLILVAYAQAKRTEQERY